MKVGERGLFCAVVFLFSLLVSFFAPPDLQRGRSLWANPPKQGDEGQNEAPKDAPNDREKHNKTREKVKKVHAQLRRVWARFTSKVKRSWTCSQCSSMS